MSTVEMRFLPPAGKSEQHIGLDSGHSAIVYLVHPTDGLRGTPLHQRYRKAAVVAGCEIAGMEEDEQPVDSTLDKQAQIIAAIEAIILADQPDDLTGNGRPKIEAIRKHAGFNVSKTEYDAAWVEFEADEGNE
ncbi:MULTISPECIES: hypothetical protein [unclassified Pseudomonas]|uniref:hypothetical protein n=1 Tax=unclassified Pseudomonas TaxID=196821 RepID=UPI00131D1BDE|nr:MULTISPECIES: hypothetical protein [unclassified Pseudomonas]